MAANEDTRAPGYASAIRLAPPSKVAPLVTMSSTTTTWSGAESPPRTRMVSKCRAGKVRSLGADRADLGTASIRSRISTTSRPSPLLSRDCAKSRGTQREPRLFRLLFGAGTRVTLGPNISRNGRLVRCRAMYSATHSGTEEGGSRKSRPSFSHVRHAREFSMSVPPPRGQYVSREPYLSSVRSVN